MLQRARAWRGWQSWAILGKRLIDVNVNVKLWSIWLRSDSAGSGCSLGSLDLGAGPRPGPRAPQPAFFQVGLQFGQLRFDVSAVLASTSGICELRTAVARAVVQVDDARSVSDRPRRLARSSRRSRVRLRAADAAAPARAAARGRQQAHAS